MITTRDRKVAYEVAAGHLVRAVVPLRGEPYVQRCTEAVFAEVARAVDAHAEGGVTTDMLHEALGLPHTQVAIALEFLKERGCVVARFRRSFPASGDTFLDAMIEWHALREQGPSGDAEPA